MRITRSLLAVLLVLVLTMGSCVAVAEEARPTQWDLQRS